MVLSESQSRDSTNQRLAAGASVCADLVEKEDCGTESSMKPVSEGGKGTVETTICPQATSGSRHSSLGKSSSLVWDRLRGGA